MPGLGLLPSKPSISLLPPAWVPGLLSSPSLGSNFDVRGCLIHAPLPAGEGPVSPSQAGLRLPLETAGQNENPHFRP